MTYDNDMLANALVGIRKSVEQLGDFAGSADELKDIAKSLRILSGRESLRDEIAKELKDAQEIKMKRDREIQALLDAVTSQLPNDMQRGVLDDAQRRLNGMKVRI